MKDCPFRTEQTLAVQVIFLSALKIAIFHDLTFFFYFYVPGSDNQAAGSADVCSGCPNQARVFPPHCNYIIAYAYF